MPVWNVTIKLADVFHDDERTIEEKAQVIVERLKTSQWRYWSEDASEFDRLVELLEKAESKAEFNEAWDEIYDLADVDRVWIETR